MPTVGKHLIDEELLALLWRYADVCEIVTRNQHTEAIRAFLDANGAPPAAALPIRTVRRGQSKADYVLAGLDDEACADSHAAGDDERSQHAPRPRAAVMVDDSVAELAEARVAADARVHRVLFVRALL